MTTPITSPLSTAPTAAQPAAASAPVEGEATSTGALFSAILASLKGEVAQPIQAIAASNEEVAPEEEELEDPLAPEDEEVAPELLETPLSPPTTDEIMEEPIAEDTTSFETVEDIPVDDAQVMAAEALPPAMAAPPAPSAIPNAIQTTVQPMIARQMVAADPPKPREASPTSGVVVTVDPRPSENPEQAPLSPAVRNAQPEARVDPVADTPAKVPDAARSAPYMISQNMINQTAPAAKPFALADALPELTEPERAAVDTLSQVTPRSEVHALTPMRAATPTLHPPVSHQIAAHVAEVRDGQTEIRLQPEELGRVRLSIHSHGDNAITVTMTAERPDTTDLMRRHLPQLERDLMELGYSSIEFDFGTADGTSDPESEDQERAQSHTPVDLPSEGPATPPRERIVSTGLDMRL